MSDVVVSNTGFFSRLKSALFGILIGLIAVPGSVILMGWNEYRTVHRTRGLNEGKKLVQTVSDPNHIDPSLDKMLVHMTGQAKTDEVLRDDLFHIERTAIMLSRDVEMYQWDEDKHTETRKKTGGGETKRTTYTYNKEWKSGRNDSESFHNSNGHINPNPHFSDHAHVAKQVNIGAYHFDEALKSSINAYQDLPWTEAMLERLEPELQDQVKIEGQWLYWSANGTAGKSNPTVGDQRIKISFVPSDVDVSLIAQQKGDSFAAFNTSNGEPLHRLFMGKLSADEVFQKLFSENNMWAWIFRAIGLGACTLGFTLILGPIAVVADVIPFLGSLTRGATFFVSLLMAVCISAVTISLSWIAVRPLIGIPMLLVAVGAAFWLFRFGSKNRKKVPVNPYRNLGADDDAVEVVG